MNFLEAQEFVVGVLDDIQFGYFTRDQVKRWINFGQREVQRRLLLANQNWYIICQQCTLVVGQPDYGLPSGFMKSHEARVITGGTYPQETYQVLDTITIQNAALAPTANGTPLTYFLTKNKLFLQPPPDRAYTLKLRYSYLVADLTADNESFDLPDQFHELAPLYAIKYGCLKDRESPADINEKIRQLEVAISADATNRQQDTPRRVRRTRGY